MSKHVDMVINSLTGVSENLPATEMAVREAVRTCEQIAKANWSRSGYDVSVLIKQQFKQHFNEKGDDMLCALCEKINSCNCCEGCVHDGKGLEEEPCKTCSTEGMPCQRKEADK